MACHFTAVKWRHDQMLAGRNTQDSMDSGLTRFSECLVIVDKVLPSFADGPTASGVARVGRSQSRRFNLRPADL